MLKRAFTLVEVVVVIALILVLAAISYPVIVHVKRAGQKTACISNLHQMGVALTLYRSQYDGADQGIPSRMGLPPGELVSSVTDGLQCHGTTNDGTLPGYHIRWPDPKTEVRALDFWAGYVSRYGGSSILMIDPNHQSDNGPRSRPWDNWTALGLRLDTSVIVKTRRGYPYTLGWWQ